MVPVLFAPFASRSLDAASLAPGARLLDLACGTGIVARRAAARSGTGGRVTALDASANMLTVAKAAAAREGLEIEWHEGRAEALPFEDGAFDAVICQFGLMFFGDRPAAAREMRRVLAPGGQALVTVWQGLDRHPFYRTLHDVIQRRAGISALQEIFALGEARELRAPFDRAGFDRVAIEPWSMRARFPDPQAFLAGEIEVDTAAIPSLQHTSVEARAEMLRAIASEMEAPLRQVTEGDHVVLDFHAHCIRAWVA